jgi:hypothetical protein
MLTSNYRAVATAATLLALGLSTLHLPIPAHAQTAQPPASPDVTVGAGLKQLVFDWARVPGATHYQLSFAPDGVTYTPQGTPILAPRSRTRVNVAVHQQPWITGRYQVAACNDHGCTSSAPVSAEAVAAQTIGYFKASNTDAGDLFGGATVLSDDGRTLVVTAALERSGATGVNGNQADDGVPNAGAVYVFRRSGGVWAQEAYLKPDEVNENQFFGFGYPLPFRAVAVSGDGSQVAVGAPGESASAGTYVGAVHLFSRDADGNWSAVGKLQSPVPQSADYFGVSVDMSMDGNTLKVTSLLPRDGEGNAEGRHHIFVRVNGAWQFEQTLAPYVSGPFCSPSKLSGDGQTLITSCLGYDTGVNRVVTQRRNGASWDVVSVLPGEWVGDSGEIALNSNATRMGLRHGFGTFSEVRLFRWNGSAWVADGAIAMAADSGGNTWGEKLAMNRTGRWLAVGDFASPVAGAGVSETVQPGTNDDGAVFLYERVGHGQWQFRRQIKAPNPGWNDGFGTDLSFSGNGRALAVSALWEDSAATGIDGDQSNDDAEEAGAVYLY